MWKQAWLCAVLGALLGCGATVGNGGVCAVGEFRCSEDVLQTCTTDQTGFQVVATCQAGLCDAAGKQCDSCKAGEGTCTGAAAGKLCSADGQTLEDVTCSGSTPYCAASGTKAACVACRTAVDCPLSTNACALAVCGADGACGAAAVAEGTTCSTSGGKCDGVGNCRECMPGEKRCSGTQPQTCGADGKWATAAACASPSPLCLGGECVQCAAATDCPSSGNACTQAACSNGACGYAAKPQGSSCSGGTCDGAGVCNACVPGTKVCNGNQVLSCNGSGQYDAPVTCSGSTPYCASASGTCVQCGLASQCPAPTNPCLQADCTAGTCGISAKADGSACVVSGDSGTCASGACVVCTSGAARCKPNSSTEPQVCSGGQWVDTVACASGESCVMGSCTTAAPVLLSRGKTATQSSLYQNTSVGLPGWSVDGDYVRGSHTAVEVTEAAWWQVDLSAIKTVSRVEIWNRHDCCQSRVSNFDIKVSTDGVTWSTWLYVPGQAQRPSVYQATPAQARYVRIEQRAALHDNPLNIAEVEVFGY